MAWTGETSVFDGHRAKGVCWSPELELFVAVGLGVGINVYAAATSPDGETWTPFSHLLQIEPTGVDWSPSLMLFVMSCIDNGAGVTLQTSADGQTWTPVTSLWDGGFGAAYGVKWSESQGQWVAVGSNGADESIQTSPDGTNWTPQSSVFDANYANSVGYSPDLDQWLVGGFGGSGETLASSPDGAVWTTVVNPFDNGAINGFDFSSTQSKWVAVGASNAFDRFIMTSVDGSVWVEATTPWDTQGPTMWGVACGSDGNTVAVGSDALDVSTALASIDFAVWEQQETPITNNSYAVAFSPDTWVIVGNHLFAVDDVAVMSGSPLAPPVSVGPVTPLWRNLVADLSGAGITDYSKLTSDRAVGVVLNAPLSASGSVPSDNPQVWIPYDGDGYDDPNLAEGSRLMWWFRRESNVPPYYTVRGATIVSLVQDDAEQDNARTRFVGRDPWFYMFSRLVRNYDGTMIGEDGISWTDTKVSVIIGELLRNTIDSQGHAFIDAGDGTRSGEGSQYQNWSGTEFYAGTLEAAPVIDWNIPQGTTVGQAWQALAAAGYCDIVLTPIYDPVNRPNYLVELNVYAQAGVTRDEAIFAWNAPGRSLVGLSRQQNGAQRANRIYFEAGQGGSIGAAAVQEDAASVAKYGSYEAQQFFPGFVANTPDEITAAIDAVTSLAAQQLLLRSNGKTTVTFVPAPERSPRPWQDYGLGDRVPVWALPEAFRELLSGGPSGTQYMRIYGWTANLSDDALETINPVLVSPEAT